MTRALAACHFEPPPLAPLRMQAWDRPGAELRERAPLAPVECEGRSSCAGRRHRRPVDGLRAQSPAADGGGARGGYRPRGLRTRESSACLICPEPIHRLFASRGTVISSLLAGGPDRAGGVAGCALRLSGSAPAPAVRCIVRDEAEHAGVELGAAMISGATTCDHPHLSDIGTRHLSQKPQRQPRG